MTAVWSSWKHTNMYMHNYVLEGIICLYLSIMHQSLAINDALSPTPSGWMGWILPLLLLYVLKAAVMEWKSLLQTYFWTKSSRATLCKREGDQGKTLVNFCFSAFFRQEYHPGCASLLADLICILGTQALSNYCCYFKNMFFCSVWSAYADCSVP